MLRRKLLFSGLVLAGVIVAGDLYAQAAIEEVKVLARKREESLQEVPIAVRAFTESEIESAGIERPADYIALMPNVTIVDSAGGSAQVRRSDEESITERRGGGAAAGSCAFSRGRSVVG